MKVLHLVSSFRARGAEVFAFQLAQALGSAGVEQLTVALEGAQDDMHFVPGLGARDLGWSHNGFWSARRRLRRWVREAGPDVILCHGYRALKIAWLAGLTHALPTVYRKIGLSERWLGRARPLRVTLARHVLRSADRVVPVSEHLVPELRETYRVPAERIEVIPNAVDSHIYDAARPLDLKGLVGCSPDAAVVVAVGALTWEKNPQALVRLAGLACRVPLHLVIVGDGPLRAELEGYAASLGVAERVHCLGARSDVPAILGAADVLVLASLSEGTPGVLIEAGMAGVPAVTWDVGGITDVVRHGQTGLVAAYGDEGQLQDYLCSMADDTAWRSHLGEAASRYCRQHFDMAMVAQRYAALFEALHGGEVAWRQHAAGGPST